MPTDAFTTPTTHDAMMDTVAPLIAVIQRQLMRLTDAYSLQTTLLALMTYIVPLTLAIQPSITTAQTDAHSLNMIQDAKITIFVRMTIAQKTDAYSLLTQLLAMMEMNALEPLSCQTTAATQRVKAEVLSVFHLSPTL